MRHLLLTGYQRNTYVILEGKWNNGCAQIKFNFLQNLGAFKNDSQCSALQYLLTNKMYSLPRHEQIRDFDQFDLQASQMVEQSGRQASKDIDLVTGENPLSSNIQDQLHLRSIKKTANPPQTSFENDWMHEHFYCFQKKVENYIENNYPSVKFNRNFLNQELFNSDLSQTQYSKLTFLLHDAKCPLSQSQAKQFELDLKAEVKLHEFLDFLCENTFSSLTEELLIVVHEVWEAYLEVQDKELRMEELRQLANKIVREKGNLLFDSHKTPTLTLRNVRLGSALSQSERRQEFKEFLTFFCETVALVIGEYCLNPHFKEGNEESSCFKGDDFFSYAHDEFSDEEDFNDFLKPKKRRKI